MHLLALDFDGVISDSAPESFVVALRTYCELHPRSAMGSVRDRVDAMPAAEIRTDRLYREFLGLMPLGNRAEDFGVALSILDRGFEVPDQASYDRIRCAEPPEFLDDFHQRFYRVRRELRSGHPTRWAELLGPYPAFVDILRRRAADVPLALATAKDRASVLVLLSEYGLADYIPQELVLDKEVGVSKTVHLERLRDRLGLAFPEITFLDDKVNHLEAVAPLGVRCALAGWGYNGEREQQLARSLGFLVCRLEDVEAQLFE